MCLFFFFSSLVQFFIHSANTDSLQHPRSSRAVGYCPDHPKGIRNKDGQRKEHCWGLELLEAAQGSLIQAEPRA
jgi:hypothetical protein